MSTYINFTLQIIAELGRSDTSITDIVQTEILNAIDYYETSRFWFNEGQATFTTSSSLATYAYPTDALEIDEVTYSFNGVRYPIVQEGYKKIVEMDEGKTFSQPALYALFNQNFRLYPVPNQTYTCAVDYQKRLATLSATSDSNAWTGTAGGLIKARVKAKLCAERFKDYEAAQAYQIVEQNERERLELQTGKLISSGRIRPD